MIATSSVPDADAAHGKARRRMRLQLRKIRGRESGFEANPARSGTRLKKAGNSSKLLMANKLGRKPRRDQRTGVTDYTYRWYDPFTGRWTSRDPIEEKGGLNLCAFINNDGLSGIDYLGQSLASLAVKQAVKRGTKGFVKNWIDTQVNKKLRDKLSISKFKTKFQKEFEAIPDMLEDEWWETCVGFIPIVGDAYDLATVPLTVRKVLKRLDALEEKLDKIIDIQHKKAVDLIRGRNRSVAGDNDPLLQRTYKEILETEGERARTIRKVIEEAHRLGENY